MDVIKDAKLARADKAISKILKKHKVAGAVCLCSDENAQFSIEFPSWSLINFQGDRLLMKADKSDPELTVKSLRVLLALKDMLGMQYGALKEASDRFIEAIEEAGGYVDKEPFSDDDE